MGYPAEFMAAMHKLVQELSYNELWRVMMGEMMVFISREVDRPHVMIVENTRGTVEIYMNHRACHYGTLTQKRMECMRAVFLTHKEYYVSRHELRLAEWGLADMTVSGP